MDPFWSDHWWQIVPLAAMAIPVIRIVFAGFNNWLHYRHRREALEVIRAYAAHGKDPPPEVIAALGGAPASYDPNSAAHNEYRYSAGPAQATGQAAFAFAGDARRAIFIGAMAGGLYAASAYVHDPDSVGRFQVAAILLGALAAASVVSAVMSSLIRPK